MAFHSSFRKIRVFCNLLYIRDQILSKVKNTYCTIAWSSVEIFVNIDFQLSLLFIYHNVDKERKKRNILFLRIEWFLIWTNFNPFTQRYFVSSLVEIVQLFWRRKSLNFLIVCSLCHYYLPLEMSIARHLKGPDFPSSKNAFCEVWLKLADRFSRRF